MSEFEDLNSGESKSPYLADEKSFIENALMAQAQGMEVLVANDHQLFLDLDFKGLGQLEIGFGSSSTPAYSVPRDLIGVLNENGIGIRSMEFSRSRSGNIHGIITLDTSFGEMERVVMEVAMGSDPKRGLLSALRYAMGIRGVSRLFRPRSLQVIPL